jgi:hypothetical protein
MRKNPKLNNKTSLVQPEEKKGSPANAGFNLFGAMKTFTPLFPVQTRKRLVYYEPSLALTGSAGVYTYYVFSANGLYDVDITSTGHQPIGWDQLMLYYEQATCLRSKITLRAANNGAQVSVVGISLAPDTTSLGSAGVFIENGLNTSVLSDSRGTNGTGQRVHELNLSCEVAKYFGRPSPREIVNDVQLCTTAAANPTEQAYYHIATWGAGGAVDNTAYLCDVLIEYDVIFWEPRKVALSLEQLHAMKAEAQLRRKLANVHTLSLDSAEGGVSRGRDERSYRLSTEGGRPPDGAHSR